MDLQAWVVRDFGRFGLTRSAGLGCQGVLAFLVDIHSVHVMLSPPNFSSLFDEVGFSHPSFDHPRGENHLWRQSRWTRKAKQFEGVDRDFAGLGCQGLWVLGVPPFEPVT